LLKFDQCPAGQDSSLEHISLDQRIHCKKGRYNQTVHMTEWFDSLRDIEDEMDIERWIRNHRHLKEGSGDFDQQLSSTNEDLEISKRVC
jgi:hypothetical protein